MTRYLRLQEGWLTVGLLAMLLFSVTLSIQGAQWSDGLTILTPITFVGLVAGLVLAKVRGVPRALLDLVGLLTGVVVILTSVASVMHDARVLTIQDRVQDLLVRTATWIQVATRGDMSDDLVVFILSLAVVAWVLAYSSAYFVFRSRQLWWALVPNGVALLINLSYSPVNLNGYIIIFMFAALLLMIRFNLLMKEERWQRERVNYSPTLTWAFLWAGSAVSILVAMAMWYVPAQAVNNTLNSMWEKVNQPWVDFQNRMADVWAGVNGNQPFGGYSSFNKSFTMGGSLNLSNDVALIVKSNERHYWRARTWDEYTGLGWRNTADETFHVEGLSSRLALDANQQLISQDDLRKPVTYTVKVLNPKGDLLFAALRPIQLSQASRLEVSWRPLNDVYNVDIVYSDPSGPNFDAHGVPLELRNLFGLLHQAQHDLRSKGTVCAVGDAISCLDQTDFGPQIARELDKLKQERAINVTLDLAAGGNYSIDVRANGEVPVYDDLSSLHSERNLNSGDEYTVESMVSTATDVELRQASVAAVGGYPDWVQSRYLNIPATVPQQVGELANEIVRAAGAENAYDKAKAIERYLRNNYEYSTTITAPPAGVDRIKWFLFDERKGYCEYYAGSMVIMLRYLGIPTRLAGGYAPGEFDSATNSYVVRESAAHAWPEVYFPGYGWVEFEPTPSQAVITHEADPQAVAAEPTPEPTTGPQPTPTSSVDELERQISRGPENTPTPGGGSGAGFLPWAIGAAVVVGAVALFFMPFSPFRRNRPPGNARFYYGRMLFWSKLMKAGPAPHQTPYEFSESLSREVPGTSLFARSIARAYVREQFSRDPIRIEERRTLNDAYQSLRGRLVRSVPARRVRALFRRRNP